VGNSKLNEKTWGGKVKSVPEKGKYQNTKIKEMGEGGGKKGSNSRGKKKKKRSLQGKGI